MGSENSRRRASCHSRARVAVTAAYVASQDGGGGAAQAPSRNNGIPLELGWLKQVQVNKSATERRTATLTARRTVKKQWQPFEETVGVVLNRLASPLQSYQVTTDLPYNLPLVPLDDVLVQQVLMNLFENAMRFSPPGSTLTLSARASATELAVSLADQGPGLPVGAEQRIFDKFFRTEHNGRSGAGLGLAICRGIVELHGGRIRAENVPAGGAVIQFTLPITGEPPRMSAEAEALEPLRTE